MAQDTQQSVPPADTLLDGPNQSLITASEARSLMSWSEDKKREFKETFEIRSRCAQYILFQTAANILQAAANRRFISRKHTDKINRVDFEVVKDGYYIHHGRTFGNRNEEEMNRIAKSRADAILKNLPPLKKAVKVIDTETAGKIEKIEVMKKQLNILKEKIDDLSEVVDMSELDQKMTVGQFRQMVKDKREQRDTLTKKMSDLRVEAQKLEEQVSKTLYAGIPGLSDAIVKVVNDHYERITALQSMTRRVGERVLFGDSTEALTLLQHFEQDEEQVSSSIHKEFEHALEVFQLSVKKLPSKKKKS